MTKKEKKERLMKIMEKNNWDMPVYAGSLYNETIRHLENWKTDKFKNTLEIKWCIEKLQVLKDIMELFEIDNEKISNTIDTKFEY